ncbi:MAG: redoxin domain-containing protein [Gemmatimonadales bacterium]
MTRGIVLALVVLAAHGAAAQDSGAVKLRFSLEEGAHVGRRAPSVVLPYATADSAGPITQPFNLAREIDRVVVLIFTRKDAVPGSADDWRAFAAHESRLPPGVIVVGVTSDSIAEHVRFARQLQLPYKLLSDHNASVTRRYGAMHGGTITPLLVVVGRGGVVRYVDPQFAPRDPASYVQLDTAIRAARERR